MANLGMHDFVVPDALNITSPLTKSLLTLVLTYTGDVMPEGRPGWCKP